MADAGFCHGKQIDEVVLELQTHVDKGLSSEEAQKRLKEHGPNELSEKPRPGFFKLLLAQFNNFLVIILIVAAVVTIFLGEYVDAICHHLYRRIECRRRGDSGVEGGKGHCGPQEDGRSQRPGGPGGTPDHDSRPRTRSGRYRPYGGRQLCPRRHAPRGERQSQGRGGVPDR